MISIYEEIGGINNTESLNLNKENTIEEVQHGAIRKDHQNLIQDATKQWKFVKDHPVEQILGEPSQGVSTRSSLRNICNHTAFLSQIEPKNIDDALLDESWILAMQEELNQFERNDVWTLVPRPKNHTIIGTKWVFRNKKDEFGVITRNKARLIV